MLFELLTGDFLFEPRKGQYYDKDDDHLGSMIELLGPPTKSFSLSGKHSRRFFDATGHLRKIRGLNHWPLDRVLKEKYRLKDEEATPFADFLLRMLHWHPENRETAQELLEHPWLTMERNDDPKMSDDEYEEMMLKINENEEKKRLAKALGSMNEDERTFSECDDSEEEIVAGDVDTDFDSSDDDDRSLGHGDSDHEHEDLYAPGFGNGKALNNSYSGPYTNMNHVHNDRGANPQFDNV